MRIFWLGVFSFLTCFTFAENLQINRKFDAYYSRVLQSYKEEKYSESFTLVYSILNDKGSINKIEDSFEFTEDILQNFLATLHKQARTLYEQEYDPKAKGILKQIEKKFDLEKLKELFVLYRNTPNGYEGAQRYASYYLDKGQYDYAAFLFEKLSKSKWVTTELRISTLTKWAIALTFAGEKKKAEEVLTEIEKEYSPTQIKFSSKKLFEWKAIKDNLLSKNLPKRPYSDEYLEAKINILERKVLNKNESSVVKADLKELKQYWQKPIVASFIQEHFVEAYCESLPEGFGAYNYKLHGQSLFSHTYLSDTKTRKSSLNVIQYNLKRKEKTIALTIEDFKGSPNLLHFNENFIFYSTPSVTYENGLAELIYNYFIYNTHTKKTQNVYHFHKKKLANPENIFSSVDDRFILEFKVDKSNAFVIEKAFFIDNTGNLKEFDKTLYPLILEEMNGSRFRHLTTSENGRFLYLPYPRKIIDLEKQKIVEIDFPQVDGFFIHQIFNSGDFSYLSQRDKNTAYNLYQNKTSKIIFEERKFPRPIELSVFSAINYNKNLFVGRQGQEFALYQFDPSTYKLLKLTAMGTIQNPTFTQEGDHFIFFSDVTKGYSCHLDF